MSALGRAPGVIIRQACRAKRVELLPSRERATPAAVAAMELALIGGSRWPSRRRRARATAAGAAARLRSLLWSPDPSRGPFIASCRQRGLAVRRLRQHCGDGSVN